MAVYADDNATAVGKGASGGDTLAELMRLANSDRAPAPEGGGSGQGVDFWSWLKKVLTKSPSAPNVPVAASHPEAAQLTTPLSSQTAWTGASPAGSGASAPVGSAAAPGGGAGGGFDWQALLKQYAGGGGASTYGNYGLAAANMIMQMYANRGSDMDNVLDSSDPRARFVNPVDVTANANKTANSAALGLARRTAQPTVVTPPKGMEDRFGTYSRPGLDTESNDGGLPAILADYMNPKHAATVRRRG